MATERRHHAYPFSLAGVNYDGLKRAEATILTWTALICDGSDCLS